MAKMTDQEWRALASEGTRTGKLATVRADGRPHVAPVWFVIHGDDVVFNTAADSVKGRDLARDPRAAFCVDDENPPFAFVILEGVAELDDDLPTVRHWATQIAARYLGAEHAEKYAENFAKPGQLVVRIRIDKVIAERDLTG
ncbi:PPOX class F420-dependent oxidoreductase [Actinocorallia lasiicapitis]